MKRASSEARNSTAFAMSSGSTQPIGRVCISWPTTFMSSGPGFSRSGRKSRIVPSFMNSGVFTFVGCTELTRMFCAPSSTAKVRIRPTTPCLAAT
jgi:hypothetical protein